MKKILKTYRKFIFSIIFSILVIFSVLIFLGLGLSEIFENKLLDFRFKYFNQQKTPSQDIIFIDISEESLKKLSPQLGGWPWPRGFIAKKIVEYVMMGKPSVFLFDILYPEYSPKTPDVEVPDDDLIMVETSFFYPNVSHAALFDYIENEKPYTPEEIKNNFKINLDDKKSKIKFAEYNTIILPYKELFTNVGQLHSVNHNEDSDGISRRNKLIIKYDGNYYPSLALVGLKYQLGVESYEINNKTLILKQKNGKQKNIPLNENGEFNINFYQSIQSFNSITAESIYISSDRLEKGIKNLIVYPDEFTNKIVIIGSSATGLKDLKVSPMGKNFAGPYLHMTAISNILQNHYITYIPKFITILIVIFSVIFIVFLTLFLKSRYIKNIIGIGYIFLHIILAMLVFKYYGIVLELTTTLIASLLSYFGVLVFLSLTEESEKRKIFTTMSKYLAPSVMKEVLENYEDLIGEVGKKKEITVLFSDIRGFTTISESYPAEIVVSVLNRYLEKMIDIIFEYNGTLDKIIGDAIMAFWGAPTDDSNRDLLAVQTGLKMIRQLKVLNKELEADGLPPLKNGIGLNTGDMIVGNIGSAKRLDFTLIGDNVNLGSRIEGLTKYYKVSILVTETTYNYTKDQFIYAYVDIVAVKGKKEGIKIYTPLAELTNTEENIESLKKEVTQFDNAHKYYMQKEFDKGLLEFDKLLTLNALGGLCEIFKKRCEYFIENHPEENWDGTWKMLDK
ncbi:MAG: hypothetical protein A2Z98_08165 [Spirochaetes bacterium GWB1_27_13]|nr:MAG: hypothetical protein A2Z98_08165 [Spirochaetes bacterium GWB1_27_13]